MYGTMLEAFSFPRIKRDFFIGRCSSSYPKVLENPYVDSNNEVVYYNTISSIQPQLSNSLVTRSTKGRKWLVMYLLPTTFILFHLIQKNLWCHLQILWKTMKWCSSSKVKNERKLWHEGSKRGEPYIRLVDPLR